MSRMVDDEFWRPQRSRADVVREELARLGVSLRTGETMPGAAPDTPPRDFNADLAIRDGFIRMPDGGMISPTLAEKLHYRPPHEEVPPGADEADLASLEESMRNGG